MSAETQAALMLYRYNEALTEAGNDRRLTVGERAGLDMASAMLRKEMARFAVENKTARADAALAEERRKRAEMHRLQALPALAAKLAGAVFDYAERADGRVLVRDQLADVLHGVLLRSGLIHKDPRFPPPPS